MIFLSLWSLCSVFMLSQLRMITSSHGKSPWVIEFSPWPYYQSPCSGAGTRFSINLLSVQRAQLWELPICKFHLQIRSSPPMPGSKVMKSSRIPCLDTFRQRMFLNGQMSQIRTMSPAESPKRLAYHLVLIWLSSDHKANLLRGKLVKDRTSKQLKLNCRNCENLLWSLPQIQNTNPIPRERYADDLL